MWIENADLFYMRKHIGALWYHLVQGANPDYSSRLFVEFYFPTSLGIWFTWDWCYLPSIGELALYICFLAVES